MAFYDDPSFRPEVRKRLDPYRAQLEAAATKHGVPPDLMFGTIAAESSGIANAVGDNGVARGIWQVQTPFMRDWLGAGPDVRNDPVQATDRIMPAFRKNLDSAEGDWALATVGYMQGTKSPAYKRIKAGEDPRQVLADKGWVLARYNAMKLLQAKRGMAPQSAPQPTYAEAKRQKDMQEQADITAMAEARAQVQVQGEQGGVPALGVAPAYVQTRMPVQGLVGGLALLGIGPTG